MITETEAYDGEKDLACHASKGRTGRTDIMFGPAGYIYIYLIYGMYWMLNIVTGKEGHAASVLIRGVENVHGPGRVTKLLQITNKLNKKELGKESGLWIEARETKITSSKIKKTKRIGVDYAGPIWAEKEYRFVLEKKN